MFNVIMITQYIVVLRLTDNCGKNHREAGSAAQAYLNLSTVWAYLNNSPSVSLYFLRRNSMKKVGIVMGSDSDLPIVKKATDTLKNFGVPFEVHVYSAHRTPAEAKEFAENARGNGFGVIIAAAGMAAHLAGAIAANTTLPVIGIPCKSSNLDGMDALLSTVQMPSGIPVATVAINGAVNAALLSCEILALEDEELADKLIAKRSADAAAVLEKDKNIINQI